MVFRLRGRDYCLVVLVRPPIRLGDSNNFWIEHSRRLLVIDAELPPEARHWCAMQLFQQIAGDDGDIFGALVDQYDSQGGRRVLEAIEAANSKSTAPREDVRPTGGKMTCLCQRDVIGGSIVNDPPMYVLALSSWTVKRRMYCSGCERGFVWGETSTETGQPLGELLGGEPPRVMTNEELADFLAKHPAIGAAMAYT